MLTNTPRNIKSFSDITNRSNTHKQGRHDGASGVFLVCLSTLTIDRVTLGEEEGVACQQHQTAIDRPQQHLTSATGQTVKQKLYKGKEGWREKENLCEGLNK